LKKLSAGASLDIEVELIERKDFLKLEEYDALFIRDDECQRSHLSFCQEGRARGSSSSTIRIPSSVTNKVYLASGCPRKPPAPRT
jgi:hypothetical protein